MLGCRRGAGLYTVDRSSLFSDCSPPLAIWLVFRPHKGPTTFSSLSCLRCRRGNLRAVGVGSHRRPEFLSSACQLPLPTWLENRPYKVWVALNPWIIIDAAVPAARTSSSLGYICSLLTGPVHPSSGVHLEPAVRTSSSLFWGSSEWGRTGGWSSLFSACPPPLQSILAGKPTL